MNPSPDRGKECLPPKKRESRQGSAEQQHVPLDEFKPPAPLRSRSGTGRGEGGREAGDGDRALTNPNPHLLPSPPPLPTPGVPLTLPWHLAYSPPVPLPLFPGQVGERRSSGSPSWREDSLSSTLPHHSRWLRGDGPLALPPSPSSSSSSSSFKTPFPADSREMWYFNTGRRDYTSSLFSPPPLFSQPPLYPPPDPGLAEVRHRYLGKRPNGLDGPSSRTASTSRPPPSGEYGNDSGRARLDFGPHGSHTNGGRRQQEDLTARIHSGGAFFPDSQTQEGPETHSSLQDRDPRGTAKAASSSLLPTSPQRLGPDPRAGRGGLLDPLGGQSAEAQIYYSLGSVYPHHSPQAQAYPLYSPSGTPLYGLQREHREPGPRTHGLRNSPHSPLGLPNSHDRTPPQRDRERDREKDKDRERDRDRERERAEQERDRERHKDGDNKDREHDRDRHERERDSERERRRDREREREFSPGQYSHPHTSPPSSSSAAASAAAAAHPPPPTLLPHFAKGSLIELAGGRLKRVEELRTEDFLRSADTSPEFHLGTCTVLLIAPGNAPGFNHLQVLLTDRNTQELLTVLVEYPFFVRDRGWSSCSPQRTTQLYGLPCRQLAEGDVCLALTPTHAPSHHRTHARTAGSRAHRAHLPARAGGGESSGSSHREEMPPPPPPPPLPHHPPPPPALATPPVPAAADPPPAPEQPRPRKRRWSAPDILPPARTDKTPPDLPHGSKQMKRQ